MLVLLSRVRSSTELVSLLGVTPDHTWDKGTRRGRSPEATHEYSGVEIRSTRPRAESADAHVDDVLGRVGHTGEKLRAFAAEAAEREPETAPIRLWVYLETSTMDAAIDLRPDQLVAISSLGAALGLNVEVLERDEEMP